MASRSARRSSSHLLATPSHCHPMPRGATAEQAHVRDARLSGMFGVLSPTLSGLYLGAFGCDDNSECLTSSHRIQSSGVALTRTPGYMAW